LAWGGGVELFGVGVGVGSGVCEGVGAGVLVGAEAGFEVSMGSGFETRFFLASSRLSCLSCL